MNIYLVVLIATSVVTFAALNYIVKEFLAVTRRYPGIPIKEAFKQYYAPNYVKAMKWNCILICINIIVIITAFHQRGCY